MNNTINNSQSSQSEKLVNDEDNEVNNGSEESAINIDNEKKALSSIAFAQLFGVSRVQELQGLRH